MMIKRCLKGLDEEDVRREPVDSIYGRDVLNRLWRIGERSSHPDFVPSFTYARS